MVIFLNRILRCNSHSIQSTHLYNSVVFSIFRELCRYHHNQFQNLFRQLLVQWLGFSTHVAKIKKKKKLEPNDHPQKNVYDHQQSVPIFFPLVITFHFLSQPQPQPQLSSNLFSVYRFAYNWTFCISGIIGLVGFCDWILSISFCVDIVFRFLGCIPGVVGLLGSGVSVLNLLGATRLFSKVAVPFYIPTGNGRRFQFLHVLELSF